MPAARRNDVLVRDNTVLIALRGMDGSLKGTAAIDKCDWERVSSISWSLTGNGYAGGSTKDSERRKILLHQLILGPLQAFQEIDHINRNKLDCRRNNLRSVTRTENHLNRDLQTNSLSSRVGVFKKGEKFEVYLNYKGEKKYLGRYNTIEEAASIREKALKERRRLEE